jgi:hypothetical protein
VGNTTFGSSPAGGVNWCVDHLQGYIYNKIVDPNGAMYCAYAHGSNPRQAVLQQQLLCWWAVPWRGCARLERATRLCCGCCCS